MPRTIATFTIAAALTAVALLGLTACTGASAGSGMPAGSQGADAAGDGGQSAASACALVQGSIAEATAEFEAAAEDPAAVVEAMNAASQKLAETAPKITNDEVAALVPPLQEMFVQAGEVMAAAAAGDLSKMDDLTAVGENFQKTSEAFQEICTP